MHEYAHIRTNTLSYGKQRYSRIKETFVNIVALKELKKISKSKNYNILFLYAIISENILFNKFKNMNIKIKE